MPSFASFLLVNEELRGVEHGERESKVGQNGRFRSFCRDLYEVSSTVVVLCLSVLINKLR